jgi:hypothetical protein
MNQKSHPPNGPAAFDVVEIVDRLSASRVSAMVESANDSTFVLRLAEEARIPLEAHLRWFDGAGAWQAIAQLDRMDDTRVSCELAPSNEWEAAPARRSVRAAVENSPLLVKIVGSKVLARGKRVHTTCVDISDSGGRVNWPGGVPRVGDAVDVSWDPAAALAGTAEWIPARISRVLRRPFGAHHVCFAFEARDARQAALVRELHRSWLQNSRDRGPGEQAA